MKIKFKKFWRESYKQYEGIYGRIISYKNHVLVQKETLKRVTSYLQHDIYTEMSDAIEFNNGLFNIYVAIKEMLQEKIDYNRIKGE